MDSKFIRLYSLFFYILLFAGINSYAQQPVSQLRVRLKTEPDSDKIKTCLEISKLYTVAQPDSAVDFCNQGIKIAEKLNDRHSEALLLLQLGNINTKHNHTELARRFDNEALSIFRNLGDKDGIVQAYDELGLLDGVQQNTSEATYYLGQAMRFYEDSHDSSGIVQTYNRLGEVFEEKGETERALTYYLRALVQYEHRSERSQAYFDLLEHIGQLYMKRGDSRSALHYLEEGVKNSNMPLYRDTQITLLDEEGKVYEENGKKQQALNYYKQALTEAKKYNQPQEQAEALIRIAGVLKTQNAGQSLDDLKKALQIAEDLHQPQLEADIYEALAGVYRQEKNYKEAMAALEEHHRLLDSLLESDTTKDIAALDSSYTLESTRQQIGHLQQVNKKETSELDMGMVILTVVILLLVLLWLYLRKINRLNRELKASNHVKDTLFSVIGHDLKGPAGSAAHLITLMETEKFPEEELQTMLSELRKQTATSFELLTSLFEWGRAQLQGVQVRPVNLLTKPLIQANISLLNQQAAIKNIVITDHTAPDTHILADHDHFDFIIRNLLSNAIKFTYEGGRIDIKANQTDGEVIFSITDTGIGISTAQQRAFTETSLHVQFGTRGEKGSGLGLLLIKEFMKANNGRIWLESMEGKGTTFYITFPVPKN